MPKHGLILAERKVLEVVCSCGWSIHVLRWGNGTLAVGIDDVSRKCPGVDETHTGGQLCLRTRGLQRPRRHHRRSGVASGMHALSPGISPYRRGLPSVPVSSSPRAEPVCRGFGAAVVSACARAVLDAGRVPYYSTDLSNLKSQAAALRCGFVPAWTEAYVYVPRQQRVDGDYLGLGRLGQAPVSTQPA